MKDKITNFPPLARSRQNEMMADKFQILRQAQDGEQSRTIPDFKQKSNPEPCTLCPGNNGFTLFEVLIALGILATMLLVLFQAQDMGINMSERSRNIAVANLLAQKKMSEIEAGEFPEENSYSGEFDSWEGISIKFRWEEIVSPVELPFDISEYEDMPGLDELGGHVEDLMKVELNIYWLQNNEEEKLTFVKFLVKEGKVE
jgi:type II secretion system protein I